MLLFKNVGLYNLYVVKMKLKLPVGKKAWF